MNMKPIRLTDILAPRVDLVRLPANNAPAPEAGKEQGGQVISVEKGTKVDSATSHKAIMVLEQLRQLLQGTPGGNALVGELNSYISQLNDEVEQATQQSQQAQVDVAAASAKQTGKPAKSASSVKKSADTGTCSSCGAVGKVGANGLCQKCDSVSSSTFKSSSGNSMGSAAKGPMAKAPAQVTDRNVGAPPNSGGVRRQGPYIFPITMSTVPIVVRKAAALVVKEAVRSGQHDLFTAQTVDDAYEFLAQEQWTTRNHPIEKATRTIERKIAKDGFAPISLPGTNTQPMPGVLNPNPKSGGTSNPGGSINGPSDGGFGEPMQPKDVGTPSNNADIMASKTSGLAADDYNGAVSSTVMSAEWHPIKKDETVPNPQNLNDPSEWQSITPKGPDALDSKTDYPTMPSRQSTGNMQDGWEGGTKGNPETDTPIEHQNLMSPQDSSSVIGDHQTGTRPPGEGGTGDIYGINSTTPKTGNNYTTDSGGNLSDFKPTSNDSKDTGLFLGPVPDDHTHGTGPNADYQAAHDDAMKDMHDSGFKPDPGFNGDGKIDYLNQPKASPDSQGTVPYQTWIQPDKTGTPGDEGNSGGTTSGEGGDYRSMEYGDLGVHLQDPAASGGDVNTKDTGQDRNNSTPVSDKGNTIVDPHHTDTGGNTGGGSFQPDKGGLLSQPIVSPGGGGIIDTHTPDFGGKTDQDADWNPKTPDTSVSKAVLSSKERTDFADAKDKKLPIPDANHVRNALARFNQTQFSSPAARFAAKAAIDAKAKKLGIKVSEAEIEYYPITLQESTVEITWKP